MSFPKPDPRAVVYEDKKLYACLASRPLASGHVIVVWKKKMRDLRLLSRRDFEYLMDAVDRVRNAMLRALGVPKVYLLYMDEANQVHWHLVPRRHEKGYTLLTHRPKRLWNFSLAARLSENLRPLR